jgi:ATP-dependent helicase HrpB
MQDFFGLDEGPALGGEPLILHLWAPNRRAEQVTRDLAGFWREHYPAMHKRLSRRYPKHHWPEVPARAKAVRLKHRA